MRPVKLEIQAMGPYKGIERIDFTKLGDKRFFLIHGPTGSGKTSILDAMTYALYGDTSGEERSLEQMRSHWADLDTESYVQFEFLIGEKLYSIKRSPKQTLNKKRGTGTRDVEADAWIRIHGEDGAVLDTGTSKVTKRVESLLGFSSEQFRQVIVLPQGKFRELLAAKGDDREEILKVLFGTERFTRIQNMIKERASDVKRRLDNLNIERDSVLRGEGALSADELLERCSMLKNDAAVLRKKLKGLDAEEKKSREEINKAAVIENLFMEKESAAEALNLLKSREEDFSQISKTVEEGKKARGLADIYRNLTGERTLFTESEQNLKLSREGFTEAERIKTEAEDIFKDIPVKRVELNKTEQELVMIESFAKIITDVEKTDEEIKGNEKLRVNAESKLRRDSEAKKELEEQIKEMRVRTSGAELAAVKAQALKLSLERITSSGKKIAEKERCRALIIELEKEIPALEKKRNTSSERADALKRKTSETEELWRRNQAAVLADSLRHGEPCPVCGSEHHPRPAERMEHTPVIEEIEKLKGELSRSEEELRVLDLEIIKKRGELESLISLIPAVEDIPEEHRSLTREELLKLHNDESSELKKASETASELEVLKKRLGEHEEKLLKLTTDIESSSSELKSAEVTLASLGARRSQLMETLPEIEGGHKGLRIRSEELKKRIKSISDFINDGERRHREASEKFSSADALLKKAESDFQALSLRVKEKEREFESRMKSEGFNSEDEFAAKLRDPEKIRELEEAVENYRRELIAAEGRLLRGEAAVRGMECPDMAPLSARLDSIRRETEEAIGAMKSAESEGERLEKISSRVKETEALMAAEEEKFGAVYRLSEIASGRNSRRLTFQRYVLQSLFEDVLMIASGRLERMSRGRYRLISPGRIGDRRSTGGLDLEVFDEYTGYSRPVVTLSGGEAFLASLSLALGLADLVQQYSGGIYLDTVFIDEGFGSLDSETLDLAVNTLIDLQSSGRLVGIISHVNELKERIDARLEVIPEGSGSRTRFVV